MSNFFSPVIGLMSRLKYPQKFLLISFVLSIPLLLATSLLFIELNGQVSLIQSELVGSTYSRQLMILLDDVLEARILAHEVIAFERIEEEDSLLAAFARIDADLDNLSAVGNQHYEVLDQQDAITGMKGSWERLKNLITSDNRQSGFSTTVDFSFITFTGRILTMLDKVATESNLYFDSDQDSNYLINVLLRTMPEEFDVIVSVRLLLEDFINRDAITPAEIISIYAYGNQLESSQSDNRQEMNGAFVSNQALKSKLDSKFQTYLSALRESTLIIRPDQLNFETLSLEVADATTVEYLETATDFWMGSITELESLLNTRLNRLNLQMYLTLAVALLMLLISIYLWIGFYFSVMRTVSALEEASDRMTSGDLDTKLSLDTRDELGQVVEAFNAIAARLRMEWSQARKESQRALAAERSLTRQNEYLSALQEMVLGLMSRLDVNELLEGLLQRAAALVGSANGYIFLGQEGEKIIERRIGFGLFEKSIGLHFHSGEGVAGKVWESGEMLVINEYKTWAHRLSGDDEIRAIIGLPLLSGDKMVGVIGLAYGYESDRIFEQAEIDLVKQISQFASIALDNAELYAEAREAREIAEAASEAKGSFLANVSHELRTPLTSVLGFARIIQKRLETTILPLLDMESLDKKEKRAANQVKSNIQIIIDEGGRLTTLINNVLDLAKIEAGKMEWQFQPINIAEIVDRGITSTSSLFEQKNLLLERDIANDLPDTEGDGDKLIQVVINLLSNSVKFTDEGKVICRVRLENNFIVVRVIDTGMGILEEDLPKVFEKFVQVGDTLTDKPKGTGLGLPICKEIIEFHGGEIKVESKAGIGSTFTFSLPLVQENDESRLPPLNTALPDLMTSLRLNNETGNGPILNNAFFLGQDRLAQEQVTQALGDAGYSVDHFDTSEKALNMLEDNCPELILFDRTISDLDIQKIHRRLRSKLRCLFVPIFQVSDGDPENPPATNKMYRHIQMPVETQTLLDIWKQRKQRAMVIDHDNFRVKTLSIALSANGLVTEEFTKIDDFAKEFSRVQPDVIFVQQGSAKEHYVIWKLKILEDAGQIPVVVYVE